MSGYDGYKPEDNVKRKANNTGESIETIGQNKNVKEWTSATFGTARSQAQAEHEKYSVLNSSQDIKVLPSEDYIPTPPKKIWCDITKKWLKGEDAAKAFYGLLKPRIKKEVSIMEKSMGKFFKDSNGNIFELVSYCSEPTATFQKVGSTETIGGAVGCLLLSDLKLIPDEQQDTLKSLYKQLTDNE